MSLQPRLVGPRIERTVEGDQAKFQTVTGKHLARQSLTLRGDSGLAEPVDISTLSALHWNDGVCEACGNDEELFRTHPDWGWPLCDLCRLEHIQSEILCNTTNPSVPISGGFFRQRSRIAHFEEPCVYFVRYGDLVKIGKAKHLQTRLSSLQTGSPVPLALVATAVPAEREKVYQKHFAEFREHGEWFRLTPEQVFAAPGVAPVLPSEEEYRAFEARQEASA